MTGGARAWNEDGSANAGRAASHAASRVNGAAIGGASCAASGSTELATRAMVAQIAQKSTAPRWSGERPHLAARHRSLIVRLKNVVAALRKTPSNARLGIGEQ